MTRSTESAGNPLSALDAVCWVMDRVVRPLDFTLIVHAARAPGLERLRAGARSARNRYPVSASITDGWRWTPTAEMPDELVGCSASSEAAAAAALEAFVDRAFDLRFQRPIRQLAMTAAGGGTVLATRVHHAAADGASAAMWLEHQLGVALGAIDPVLQAASPSRPPLRMGAIDARSHRPGGRRRSVPLWHRPGRPGRERRWRTIEFACADLVRSARAGRSFTYNDLLATIALDVVAGWNREHGLPDGGVGLWLPVNIRRDGRSGFGNGTSRIRVHAPHPQDAPFPTRCRQVHQQISQSMRQREWAVPSDQPMTFLPQSLRVPLLRGYLDRPWADVGSLTFSHVDRWGGEPREVFDRVHRIDTVGPLHSRHCAAITGVTHGDRTWLTFAYDPALLTGPDVEALAAMYGHQVGLARQELACAA